MTVEGAVDRPAGGAGVAAAGAAALSIADDLAATGLIGGVSPDSLVERFGSPLFVYDLDMIAARVRTLQAVLPSGFRLAFAVKSNPSLAVVAGMAALGIGADVASAGELATVLRAGFAGDRVLFTGPGKRDEELADAVAAGVSAVTVESPGELRRLDRAAAGAGRRQPVLLRLAVGGDSELERVRLIGHAGGGKFGIDLPSLYESARYAAASAHLELLGVHAFGASNVLDADGIARHVSAIVAVGRDVAAQTGVPLRLVDAGGGLGIPYADREAPLDLARFGLRFAALRAGWDNDPILRDTEVLLEPGRFFVGPAGVYLARVLDVKGPEDSPVAILDGGINHLLRPALVKSEQRVRLVGRAAQQQRDLVESLVAGPLCTGLDVFAERVRLPRPQAGDVVAVLDAGAYGFTESMPFFLSHAVPAEVALRGGDARLVRPRLSPAELLDRQVLPDW